MDNVLPLTGTKTSMFPDMEDSSADMDLLSTSGRLSLSDITAATIGQLGPEDWAPDSPPKAGRDSGLDVKAVHRPWTDTEAGSDSSGPVRQKADQLPLLPCPTYIVAGDCEPSTTEQPLSKRLKLSNFLDHGQNSAANRTSRQLCSSFADHGHNITGPSLISDFKTTATTTSGNQSALPPLWMLGKPSTVDNFTTPVDNFTTPVKQETVTPVKVSRPFYASPAGEARFSESLTNLLGSPPPDSPLSKNPYFGDLAAILAKDCHSQTVPESLISINSPAPEHENVFTRERKLQARFLKLQGTCPREVSQLSSFFRYQSALIETDRFRTLHENQHSNSYKESLNRYYDNQLHDVMDRVEQSVLLMEKSNQDGEDFNSCYSNQSFKARPHLHKGAIRLMEEWYSKNEAHPYPTSTTVEALALAGNVHTEQVKKWFANKRNRSHNTRSLTQIAMQKRKLGQLS